MERESKLRAEMQLVQREIAEYKRIFDALSATEQNEMRRYHELGLSDLVAEEVLLLEELERLNDAMPT